MTEALRRLFIVGNTLSRILQRDKPKAQIVESQVKKFFKETNAEEAVITIKENRNTRTGLQNNLYWVIIKQVRLETRNSEKAIHDHLREELLEVKYEELAGKPQKVLKSTTELNTKDMGTYIGDCIDYVQGELIPGFRLELPDGWQGLLIDK
jgi:hypothetical protein